MRGPLLLVVCSVTALAGVQGAAGHLGLSPAGLPAGAETRVALEIPNERQGHVTTDVEVRVPDGIALVTADALSGWTANRSAGTVQWSGGRIEGTSATTFHVTLRPDVPVGTYLLALRQGYDDGRAVETETSFTVIPGAPDGPPQHLGRALAAAAVGLVVVAGTLLVMRRLRRRSTPA